MQDDFGQRIYRSAHLLAFSTVQRMQAARFEALGSLDRYPGSAGPKFDCGELTGIGSVPIKLTHQQRRFWSTIAAALKTTFVDSL
jgi:hypothetical protein